jgi:biotin operon repressor
MINRTLLKQTMHEYGDTQTELAEALSISLQDLNRKINETQEEGFTIPEMFLTKERYQLSNIEANAIFFEG